MSTFEATLSQLPDQIQDKLKSLISRVRCLMLIKGVFATLTAGISCLLVIMAIDASLTIFSSAARWALSLAGLAVTLVAAWWFLLRPLSRKITMTSIARILEVRHPELQERISTAVELMSSDDPNSIKGSEELIAAVVDSAVIDVEKVDPKTEFKPAKATKFMTAAGVGVLVIALLMLIWPKQAWTLMARAFAPFLDIGNAYADTLVVDPGDIRVAVGEPVTIQITVKHKRLNRAELRRKLPDGTESIERMTLMGSTEEGVKRFLVRLPSIADSFEYRVRAGSAVSEFYDVTAVPPPVVERLTVRYDFPEYTKLDIIEGPSDTGEIRALAHTEVTVTADLNKALTKAELRVNDSQFMGEPTVVGNKFLWKFPLKPRMNGTWRFDLTDADGFKNVPTNYSIQALPDKVPRVVIESPQARELRLKPTEVLPIRFAITEDFGFSKIDLVVRRNNESTPIEIVQPTPESDGEPGVWRGTAQLNLASLKLENQHRRLEVQLRARDNRPAEFEGPGEGSSDKIVIIIDRNAESLAQQTIRAQKKELEKAIREAEQDLRRARDDVKAAENQLAKDEEINDNAKRELKEFQENANEAQEKLQEIAAKLEASLFNQQAETAKKIADEQIAEARETADMIPVTDEKNNRIAEARKAREQVEQAMKELDEMKKSIRDSDDELKMVAELNDLANEQRELAQKSEISAEESKQQRMEMAKNGKTTPQQQQQFDQQQQQKMDQFRREQEKVQKELGDLLKEDKEALRDVMADQKKEAEQLAEQAKAMSEQQKELADMTKEATQAKTEKQEKAFQEKLMEGLQDMQKQIAKETQDLKNELNKEKKGAGEPLEKPAEETQEAAKNLVQAEVPDQQPKATEPKAEAKAGEENESEMAQAAESAKEAAEALAEAAEKSEAAAVAEKSQQEKAEAAEKAMAQHKNENAEAEAKKPEESPKSPFAAEETQSELGELAEAQSALAEQIAAVAEGNFEAVLESMEQQMAAQTDELQEAAEALETALQNTQQNTAKSRADQAENALEQAMQKQDRSTKQMEAAQTAEAQADAQAQQAAEAAAKQGKPAPEQPPGMSPRGKQQMQQAQQNQQKAAQNMAQAAKSLEQTAQAIAQSLAKNNPKEGDENLVDSEELAESFQDVTESAQSNSPQQAAEQSQEAAESLQQLTQAAMEQMGALGQGEGEKGKGEQKAGDQQEMAQLKEGDQPQLNESGKKMADMNGDGIPPELRAMGVTAADWAKMKGTLTGGSATAIETNLPGEYRELVGRYFQVIAKEAKGNK